MKHFLITLTMGLFTGPLFSQVGNYQKIQANSALTLRKPQNGEVFYYARNSQNNAFYVVSGNGSLDSLKTIPVYPGTIVPQEDTMVQLNFIAEIQSGILFHGTKVLKEENNTKYISPYTEIFNWNFESIFKYEPGHSLALESHSGIVYSDSSLQFLGHDWVWDDSTYRKVVDTKFFYSFDFLNQEITKDTVDVQMEWEEKDFQGGIWFGDRIIQLGWLNAFEPNRNWSFNIQNKVLTTLEFPFSLNPDPNLKVDISISMDRKQILALSYLPLRKDDFPDFDSENSKKLFFYYLDSDLEVIKHFAIEDIEYKCHPVINSKDFHGNQEDLFGDTIRLVYGVNEITNNGLDSISPYTGEIYTDGYLLVEYYVPEQKILDRRFISRIEVTGENFNPEYFGHVTTNYFFNLKRDSVTLYSETQSDLNKMSYELITIALDDMPLSTPGGLTASQIQLYPNPASEEIQVHSRKPGKYSLFNQEGKNVGAGDYWPNSTISLNGMVPGAYVIQIEETNSPPQQFRFLIKK